MYDEIKLPNGIRVIGERIPHFRSVSVGLWLNAGSMMETPAQGGISHMIEHMLFKGTQKRTARRIAEEIDGVGGQLNAFTGKECTCYYVKVMDSHLPLAMDVLCDMLLNASLDEGELAKEKGVVLEEIGMAEDTPEDLVHELLSEAVYPDHPLGRPILGGAANVRGFTREDLIAYRAQHYCPENTILAIAGNYDLQQFVELATRLLSDWGSQPGCADQLAPVTFHERHIQREKDIEQLHLCVGFPGIAIGSEDAYPFSILNNLFGGAMSSRLFQKIREEKGLAYSVYSYPTSYPSSGMFSVYAGMSEENAPQVLDMIAEEIRTLKRDGFPEAELSQAREQMKGSYILGLESASSRMSAIGRRMLLLGDTITEDKVIAKIDAVRGEDVMRVMEYVFAGPYAVSAVGKGAAALNTRGFMA